MDPFVHDTPAARVVFAPGALASVGEEAARLGAQRVLLVAGEEQSAAAFLEQDLGARFAGRFTDVVMHVPVPVAERAAQQAAACRADLVVSLGGGSATGMAKAIALRTSLPVLAVPTTFAGSEMTSIWGQTEGAAKTTGRDRRVLPRVVVYDPELTLPVPSAVAATSGMNAIAHAVEGLYSAGASPVTALMAEEAIRALASALPRIAAAPDDVAARGDALYGAWLAGWVLGTAGMGVHHKVCHVLGGTWDLPHAEVHSAVLPYAAAFNADAAPQAMARAARALGAPQAGAAAALWDLASSIGAPVSLAELGFSADSVRQAAQLVVAGQPANPRPVDQAGIETLLGQGLAGQRPTGAPAAHFTHRLPGPATAAAVAADPAASGGPGTAGGQP